MRSTKHKLSVFPNRQWEDLFFPLLQASLWQPITNWCESILKTKISQFPLFNFINSRFHTKVIFFSKAYKEIVIQLHMRIYYGYTSLSRKKKHCHESLFPTQRDCYLTWPKLQQTHTKKRWYDEKMCCSFLARGWPEYLHEKLKWRRT